MEVRHEAQVAMKLSSGGRDVVGGELQRAPTDLVLADAERMADTTHKWQRECSSCVVETQSHA